MSVALLHRNCFQEVVEAIIAIGLWVLDCFEVACLDVILWTGDLVTG